MLRVASLKNKLARAGSIPGPNDPGFQAYTADLAFVEKETTRITAQFYAGLGATQTPEALAEFLTVEMRETLRLEPAQQTSLLSYIRDRLAQGPTLKDAEKAMADSRQAEADQIKATLPRGQQRLFDRVYGADGMCLFQFIQLAAAKG